MCLSLLHSPLFSLRLIIALVYILSFVFPVVAAATACSSLSRVLPIRISIRTHSPEYDMHDWVFYN